MPSYGYNIIAGTKDEEGAIISRNRFGAAHVDLLDSANGKWFLVQANKDEWKDGCDGRCKAATDLMNQVGRANITVEKMRTDVL